MQDGPHMFGFAVISTESRCASVIFTKAAL